MSAASSWSSECAFSTTDTLAILVVQYSLSIILFIELFPHCNNRNCVCRIVASSTVVAIPGVTKNCFLVFMARYLVSDTSLVQEDAERQIVPAPRRQKFDPGTFSSNANIAHTWLQLQANSIEAKGANQLNLDRLIDAKGANRLNLDRLINDGSNNNDRYKATAQTTTA